VELEKEDNRIITNMTEMVVAVRNLELENVKMGSGTLDEIIDPKEQTSGSDLAPLNNFKK
jgi:hypothetical protein